MLLKVNFLSIVDVMNILLYFVSKPIFYLINLYILPCTTNVYSFKLLVEQRKHVKKTNLSSIEMGKKKKIYYQTLN